MMKSYRWFVLVVVCECAILQTGEDGAKKGTRSTITISNPSSSPREILWLGAKEQRVIGRVGAWSELQLETFVGHELGWKANETLEESITVTVGLERVLLGASFAQEREDAKEEEEARALPSSEELDALDRVLSGREYSLETFSREVAESGRRGAYYSFRVDSVETWRDGLRDGTADRVAVREVTRFGGRRVPTAAAFEWEQNSLVIVYEDGSSCDEAFCDGAIVFESNVFRLGSGDTIPKLAGLSTPPKGRRLLRFGCDAVAVWLATKSKDFVACLDDDLDSRLRAKMNARALGARLTTLKRFMRRFDLVFAAVMPPHVSEEDGEYDVAQNKSDNSALVYSPRSSETEFTFNNLPFPPAHRRHPSRLLDYYVNNSRAVLRPGGSWLVSSRDSQRRRILQGDADLDCEAADLGDNGGSEDYFSCVLLSRGAARRRRQQEEDGCL